MFPPPPRESQTTDSDRLTAMMGEVVQGGWGVPERRELSVAAVVLAAVLWGLSGTAASALFTHYGVSPAGLVAVRMSVAGLMLLVGLSLFRGVRSVLAPLTGSPGPVLIFALAGLLVVQYSYLLAIADSNAATATLLQYLAPGMVVIWVAGVDRRLPGGGTVGALLLTVFGTALLVTGGSFTHLLLGPAALGFGLLSAVALAFYSLYPVRLLRRYGPLPVVAWGLFIGGLVMDAAMAILGRPLLHGRLDLDSLALVAFVACLGTLAAFPLYLSGLNRLNPSIASILSAAEPLAAAVASVVWLHLRLTPLEWLGGLGIAAGVLLMARTARSAGQAPAPGQDEPPSLTEPFRERS